MMKLKALWGRMALVALISVLTPLGACAVLISYTEPPDLGDGVGVPTNLGLLDIGLNTITGIASPSDLDAFAVTLASPLQIDFISLDVSGQNGSIGTSLRRNGTLIASDPIAAPGLGNFNLFAPVLPATTPAAYSIAIDPNVGTKNFTFGISVSQVPEPASLLLMGLGLLSLGMIGRRHRRR